MGFTYLTELIRTIQHGMCRTPSYVAMERNLERLLYSTSDLSVLEIFDPLSGGLNLGR